MKIRIVSGLLMVLASTSLLAQKRQLETRGLPFMKKSDQRVMAQQTEDFFLAIQPLSEKLGEHAVNVFASDRMLGRGTVTELGVVAKWSEVMPKRSRLSVVGHDGVSRAAFVKAVYLEYDLALLSYDGGLVPVDFNSATKPQVGKFILAVGPAKDSHGFGVVSVEPRSLRERDKAYLGVRMESAKGGVLIEWAEPGSAAARAGLERGDLVVAIDDFKVSGLHEMSSYLQKLSPGDSATVHTLRGDKKLSSTIKLGARPERRQAEARRMQQMKSMGGSINAVAEGFPDVLQSDMQVDPADAGSPVFDLDGKFVGVIVARASRIKTYIVTADRLAEQLKKKPDMEASPDAQFKKAEVLDESIQSPEVLSELRRLKALIERSQRRVIELEGQ